MGEAERVTEAEIAAFQAALLEILADGEAVQCSVLRSRLQQSADCAPFSAYMTTFEDPMIEVAVTLVQQWGIR
jgi:hypothetical protein